MPFNPQPNYHGDAYLFQGITQGAQNFMANLRDYQDRGRKTKAIDPVIMAYAPQDPEKQKELKAALPGMSLEQKEGMVRAGAVKQSIAQWQQQQADKLADNARADAFLELQREAQRHTQDLSNRDAVFTRNLGEGLNHPGQPTFGQQQNYFESSSSEMPEMPQGPANVLQAYANAAGLAGGSPEAARALPGVLSAYATQEARAAKPVGPPVGTFTEQVDPVTGLRRSVFHGNATGASLVPLEKPVKVTPDRVPDVEKMKHQSLQHDLSALDTQIASEQTALQKLTNPEMRLAGQNAINGLKKRRNAIRTRMDAILEPYTRTGGPVPQTAVVQGVAQEPGAPAAPAPAPATSTVTTQAQYDALDSGAIYTGKDGRRYRKP